MDWMTWTPIMEGMCELHDLRTKYTLTDVLDMHEAIAETAIAKRGGERDP
ncbi:hypothetical protein LU604_26665 (plasmid) [Erwinia tracheiphila]|nr:hypothetical protein [Erwinia tracheiphila]UIA86026.1 hypothetical protein LU604_26665 [Erwinia tracheiphila]